MQAETTALLQAIKGAPLTCLIALRILQTTAQANQVAAVTGYDEETARKSLAKLEALSLVNRIGPHRWQINYETAQQLPLFTPSQLPKPELSTELSTGAKQNRGNPAVLKSSSSSLMLSEEKSELLLPPPRQPTEKRGNPAVSELIRYFQRLTIISHEKAVQTAEALLARTDTLAAAKIDLYTWHMYARDHDTIRAPGYFIASQILAGAPVPYGRTEPTRSDEHHLAQLYEEDTEDAQAPRY